MDKEYKSLSDVFLMDTVQNTVELLTEDAEIPFNLRQQPISYNSKTQKVFAGNYNDKKLYRMHVNKLKWTMVEEYGSIFK